MKKIFLAISAIALSMGVSAHTQTPAHIQKVGIAPEIPVSITVHNGRKFTADMWVYVDDKKVGQMDGILSGGSKRFTVGIKVDEDQERKALVCTEAHPNKVEIKTSFISRVCTVVQVYRYPSEEQQ